MLLQTHMTWQESRTSLDNMRVSKRWQIFILNLLRPQIAEWFFWQATAFIWAPLATDSQWDCHIILLPRFWTVDLGSLLPCVPLRELTVSHRSRAKGREGMNNQSSISSSQGLPSDECEVTLSTCAVCPALVHNWQKFLCSCIPQECFRNAVHVILIMRHRIKG